LAVFTVNMPLRLARQEPEANVIVLTGVVLRAGAEIYRRAIRDADGGAGDGIGGEHEEPAAVDGDRADGVVARRAVENEVAAAARQSAATTDRVGQIDGIAAHGDHAAAGVERDRLGGGLRAAAEHSSVPPLSKVIPPLPSC